MLTGKGHVSYGFDGSDTYVIETVVFDYFKSWRFRKNIANTSGSPGLGKKTASAPLPLITYGSSGKYKVTLLPVGGGKTLVQIFDILGRLTYKKVVDEAATATSFTIPLQNTPRTPFITRAKNDIGVAVQRSIPVK